MKEIWKDIKFTDTDGVKYDYIGLYQVSNFGRVRSLNYRKQKGKIKILEPKKHKGGYLQIRLCKNGERKLFLIHRLVAHMYIKNDNSIDKTVVNHKDHNGYNNHYTNLEWCTQEYNQQYSHNGAKHTEETKKKMSKNHHMRGKHHPEQTKRKIGEANSTKIMCIETKQIFNSLTEASKWLGVKTISSGKTSISNCLSGRTKTAYGYHWQKIDCEE